LRDQFNSQIVLFEYKELILFANCEMDGNGELGVGIYDLIYRLDALGAFADPVNIVRGDFYYF